VSDEVSVEEERGFCRRARRTWGDYQKDNRMQGRDKSSLRFVSMEAHAFFFILGARAAWAYDLRRIKQLLML
jgi:hypothetical protein